MLNVEQWAEIRRLYYVQNLSQRKIAKRLRLNRRTVARAIDSSKPPHYQRAPRGSILDPYKAKVHALLSQEPDLSAVRIWEIIQVEGYPGQIGLVRNFVHDIRWRYRPQVVYQRTEYQAGEYAQVDWAQMPGPVLWQGQWCTVYAFVMVLCYSRLLYVEFSLSTKLWDFLRCHQHGLQAFGGVPKICVYDNMTSVVKQRRGTRVIFNPTFEHFAGHYRFQLHACWPGQPHQKGLVERPIHYLKSNFWAGRVFADYLDLQQQGQQWLANTANVRLHRVTRQRPLDRFAHEKSHLLLLPQQRFDTDWLLSPKVSKQCLVRVDTNDYSVPARCYRQPVEVRVDDRRVRVWLAGQQVAEHQRCYDRHQVIIDPQHQPQRGQNRAQNRFTKLKQGFLEAYGATGQQFYEGLGRRTDHLSAALAQILTLEQQFPHQDIVKAMQVVMQQGSYDPAAVKYWLMFATKPTAVEPIPVPDTSHIPVEERHLAVYDALIGVGL